MTTKIYDSLNEILEKAKQAEGKTFKELSKNTRLTNLKNKGALGHVIEEDLFGYEINSNREPDFSEWGVELKVTPVKKLKNNSFSAKERLVLGIINYMEDYKETFESSSFLKKSSNLLLLFYLWEEDIRDNNYKIIKSYLLQFSEADLEIIKQDWTIIMDKINNGQAHEITEADTNYLAACTKGATALTSFRKQPFSDMPAKQRAYSLKSSYMTGLIRRLISVEQVDSLFSKEDLSGKSIEQALNDKLCYFYNLPIQEIQKQLHVKINPKTKNYLQILISQILNIKGTHLNDVEEFQKANIQIKTIRLLQNDMPQESMSFPAFKFTELIQQTWEESDLYNLFNTQKFLFIIFQFSEEGELIFKGIKLWNMPYHTLETAIKDTWIETISVINKGIRISRKNGRLFNNLPNSNFNQVCHVRPHARNAADTYPLPDGRKLTKQCFWLDRRFIKEIIESK